MRVLIAMLLSGVALLAHDPSKHKGRATAGEVVAITGDSLDLKTATGTIKVTLAPEVKVEHGDQTVDRSHLQKGQKVTVFGTRLASGELVAKEVVIGAAHAAAAHKKK